VALVALLIAFPAVRAQESVGAVLYQRGDLGRSGSMEGPGPAKDPVTVWKKSFPGFLDAPVVSGGMVVFGGGSGVLYGIETDTAGWVWGSEIEGMVSSAHAIFGGIVYASGYPLLGNAPGVYAAFTLATGAERWRYETEGNLTGSAMLVSGSTVVLALPDPEGENRNDQIAAAFHLTEEGPGELYWSFPLGGAVSAFAEEDGILVVAAANRVYGIDLSSGELQWTYSFIESAGTPAIGEGVVVVPDYASNTYHGIDLSTGEQLWGFNPDEFLSPAAIADGKAFVHGGNALFALDLQTGDEIWAYRGADDFGPPTVSSGVVYVGSWVNKSTGALIALDEETGGELWRVDTPENLATASPVVSNGTVYAASGMGTLYAVGGTSD
jgi:outer membrane protein assembly factor BamB